MNGEANRRTFIDRPGKAPLLAVLVILAAAILAGGNILDQYTAAINGATAQLSALARSAGVQVGSTVAAVDGLLRDVAAQAPPAVGRKDAEFNDTLAMLAGVYDQIVTLSVVDMDGTVRFSGNTAAIGHNIGARPCLDHFRDHPADSGLFIAGPVVALSNTPAVLLARAVRSPHGNLLGVAVALMPPGVFETFLESARSSYGGGAATLIGPNRAILAHIPDPAHEIAGRSLEHGPLLARHLGSGALDSVQRGTTVFDRGERLAAFRTARHYPITVAVSAPVVSILQPWLRQTIFNLGVLAVVAVGAVVMAGASQQRALARQQAEHTLQAERDFSRALIDSLPGLFYLFDADGRFLRWNANFETFTGRSAHEIANGLHPLDLFDGDDRTAVAARIADVLTTGDAEIEADLVAKTGERRPHFFTGLRMIHEGRPCVVGVGLDISAMKKLQMTLQSSNEDLRQFAYVASHQLQEPLRTVASYVQLLERRYRGKLDADADEFIGFAVAGVKRMSALINDLLAFAGLSARADEPGPVNCNAVLRTVLADLTAAVENAKAKVNVADPLPTVHGDETLISTLLHNLLSNALKYRHPERPPQITISARRKGAYWEFSVADNGIGIDPQHFATVFELFQRLHRQSEYEGTGIGLAISRKIVERHGGRVWLESRMGDGTTFKFTLPA